MGQRMCRRSSKPNYEGSSPSRRTNFIMKNNKINEYIATKVLEYEKVETIEEYPHNGSEFKSVTYTKNGVKIKGGLLEGMLPSYTTSLYLSFNLLEELRYKKVIYSYKIMSPILGCDRSYNVYIYGSVGIDSIQSEASSSNLPTAICQSVIKFHKALKRIN